MTAEQRILSWLERADFDGTGCRHSQDTIAAATGYTRRTVIRATKSLAEQGLITVGKERRPGCKWLCNVYRVAHWNPHKRSGVLNVLASIRERRSVQCHTERTATSREGSYAPDTSPSEPQTYCRDAARKRAKAPKTERTRMGTQPSGHLHQLDVFKGCEHCRELLEMNNRLQIEISGTTETVRTQGKEIARLKRQLSDETTPTAQAVRKVLDKWAERHPKANIDPTGYRARVVRSAVKLGHTNPPLACPVHDAEGKRDKDAVCTVPDELIEAVEGLFLMPFTGPHGRCPEMGPGRRRHDGIEYALTDRKTGAASEATIERFRGYARWAELASSERLYAVYQRTGDVHSEYADRLMRALAREGHAA